METVCPYCVQWRCAICHATDTCDHDYSDEYTIEPYWPDGSVAVLTQSGPCGRCTATLLDYYADHT